MSVDVPASSLFGFANKPMMPSPTVGITQKTAHMPKPIATPTSWPVCAHGSVGRGIVDTLTIP
jgi:hypothetical protein